ncbi:MAG: hypothetical protein QOH39_2765 [Verrucomicrobiota bacterium]|jgi:hypothetical protein
MKRGKSQLALRHKPEPGGLTEPKWRTKFLRALRKSPSVKDACAVARISRATAYRHKEQDNVFAERWREAIEDAIDDLVEVAWKRAAEGDSTVLTFLLRCHRPQVYRDIQRHEVGVAGGIVFLPAKAEGNE